MRERTVALFTLFCLFVNNVSASVKPLCFIDQHLKKIIDENKLLCNASEWMTDFTPDDNSDQTCSDTDNSLNGVSYPFYRRDQPDDYKEKFVFDGDTNDEDAFLNVTISEIKFKRLWIRVQTCAESKKTPYWQMVNLNSSHDQRLLSLFFSVNSMYTMKIAFYAEGENDYKFFRQYVFMAPSAFSRGYPNIDANQLLAYVDTTISDEVCLYIQPFPQDFHIVRYEVVFQYRDKPDKPGLEKEEFNLTQDIWHHDQLMFSNDAMYKFVITPVSANGKKNATTCIEFYMKASNHKLIVMMVSLLVLPIVICFVLYLIYAYCRYQAYRRFKEPYCLLIYPATHDSHVDVMLKLAEYLKACRINAMIDVLDIPKEPDNNPKRWCEKSFKRASTVVVSWSLPPTTSIVVKTMYRGLDECANALIHYCTKKKYLTIKFPYCNEEGAPAELRSINPLILPEQLKKLINQIHDFDYTKIHVIPDPKELIQSIRSAQQIISKCVVSNSRPHPFGELPDFVRPLIIEPRIFDDMQDDTSSSDRNSEVPEDDSDDEYRIPFESLNLHGPQDEVEARNT